MWDPSVPAVGVLECSPSDLNTPWAGRDLHVVSVWDRDSASLAQSLQERGASVLILDASTGLADLNTWLDSQGGDQPYEALHLYSHGQSGRFFIGGQSIDGDALTGLSNAVAALAEHLSATGDLLIYGCSVGADAAGRDLISNLAAITGRDIAASSDSTGGLPGSDWDLEVRSGEAIDVACDLQLSLDWQGSLALPALTTVLGEAVVGAFAGWTLQQILPGSSGDASSYTSSSIINLVFPEPSGAQASNPRPDPIPTGIQPGQPVTSALYIDSSGDLVDIRLSGPGSFSLRLAGGLANNADALELVLKDTDATTALSISTSPIEQPINAGIAAPGVNGQYNRLFSPGYTTIDRITASGAGAVGDIELTAVIANSIDLKDHAIGSLALDCGFTTLVDRVNTSSSSGDVNIATPSISVEQVTAAAELELFDESPTGRTSSTYNPVTGLIDLGDVKARSIGLLSVNGSISAPTLDPNDDEDLTNDLRGTVTVSGRIGAIEAQRSALTGSIRAGSIGSVNLGRIRGELTTTDANEALTLNLTSDFRGFVKAAGHLNLGFSFTFLDPGSTVPPVEAVYGEVQAGGGISGTQPSLTDTILVPHQVFNVYRHTGTGVSAATAATTTNAIADVVINGLGSSRWISAGDIGSISANSFSEAMLVEATGDIGNIEAYLFSEVANPNPSFPPPPPIVTELNGLYQAGGNIGDVKSATSVAADLRAGGSIGNVTAFSGGINSVLIEAGSSIGDLWAHSQTEAKAGKVVAKTGSIGDLYLGHGNWGTSLIAAADIGDITLIQGSLQQVTLAAGGSIGDLQVSGSVGAIEGGSLVAGVDIGSISATTTTGIAISGALIQADSNKTDLDANKHSVLGRIGPITAVSYGASLLPAVVPGLPTVDPAGAPQDAIRNSRILGAAIGTVDARAQAGIAIVDTLIQAQASSIHSISGIGANAGLVNVTAVAEQDVGPLQGRCEIQGDGIRGSRFNANTGSIGSVSAEGGAAGGHGIVNTTLQAAISIGDLTGISQANQGDGINKLTAYSGTFGSISALVRGGEGSEPQVPPPPVPAPARTPTGSGIVDSLFRGLTNAPSGIAAIQVSVNSIVGQGIRNSRFAVKGSIGAINVSSYNNSAIVDSTFSTSRSDISNITAESVNSGSAILRSSFTADNGNIGLAAAGISATAKGTSPSSHGIQASQFSAADNIGAIRAFSAGGAAINDSTFTADSDLSSSGKIDAITAISEGQHLEASAGIFASSFTGAAIGPITAEIRDFDAGAGISGSTFTARTATHDGAGNFDNRGRIGNITVKNASRIGNGIETSRFLAGAAGRIGNINVNTLLSWEPGAGNTMGWKPKVSGLSGKGIYLSSFQASRFDIDQNNWSGSIGSINVTAGRVRPTLLPQTGTAPNDQWTAAVSGIDLSYFAAYGGIGDITVDTLGTGIFGSAFLADFDLAGTNNLIGLALSEIAAAVQGNLGNITIRAKGRFASGSVLSAFTGQGIGRISIEANVSDTQQPPPVLPTVDANSSPLMATLLSLVRSATAFIPGASQVLTGVLTANSRLGPAGVVGSIFAALEQNINGITVTNTGASQKAALGSIFMAKGNLGDVRFTPQLTRGRWLANGAAELAADLILRPLGFNPVAVFLADAVALVGTFNNRGTPITPAITAVGQLKLPAATRTYRSGSVLNFTVNFGSPVVVSGSPYVSLLINGIERQAVYSRGSGSSALRFRYVVQPGEVAKPGQFSIADVISMPADSTLQYRTGNTTTPITNGTPLTLNILGNPAQIEINAAAPTIQAFSGPSTMPARAGATITVTVQFSEAVDVSGIPFVEGTIAAANGNPAESRPIRLTYRSGSGTNTLRFTRRVTAADLRAGRLLTWQERIRTASGSSISDRAGNPAQLAR